MPGTKQSTLISSQRSWWPRPTKSDRRNHVCVLKIAESWLLCHAHFVRETNQTCRTHPFPSKIFISLLFLYIYSRLNAERLLCIHRCCLRGTCHTWQNIDDREYQRESNPHYDFSYSSHFYPASTRK